MHGGILTAYEVPQVQPQGSMQGLIGSAEGIEQEECWGHRWEDYEDSAEEQYTAVKDDGYGTHEIWENWQETENME